MKRSKKFRFITMQAIAILVLIATMVVACTNAGDITTPEEEVVATEKSEEPEEVEETAVPEEKEGPIEITFWHALGGNNGAIIEDMINEFNSSQNEVFVKHEFQGAYSDTELKFMAAIASESEPDVVMLEISRIPGFAYSGALQPLDEYAAGPDSIDLEDFSEGLLSESRIDGKLYSLPQARSMPVFYYNKTMLEEAGFDTSAAPANWEELREAAIAVTKEDGSQIGFGIQIGNPWWYFQMAVENGGGEISTLDGTTCTPAFNGPEAVAALQWWYDLVNVDNAARIYVGEGLTSWETLQADFISGKVGMMFITTGWMGNIVNNSDFEVGVGMIPEGLTGIRRVPTGGNGLVIPMNRPAEKKEAAWKFLKWVTDTSQTAYWAMQTGYMPLRFSALNDPKMQLYFEENPNFKVAVEQMEFVSPFPCIKMNPKTESTCDVLWERIFVAEEPVQDVADDVASQVQELMEENE